MVTIDPRLLDPVCDSNEIENFNRVLKYVDEVAGGGSGGSNLLTINAVYTDDSYTLDRTWQEIRDALKVGMAVIVEDSGDTEARIEIPFYASLNVVPSPDPEPVYSYYIVALWFDTDGSVSALYYYTDSVNGYPVYTED